MNKIDYHLLLFGVIIFVVCLFSFSWKAGFFFFACSLLISLLDFSKIKRNKYSFYIILVGALFCICFSSQMLLGAGFIWELPLSNIILEVMISITIYAFVMSLTKNDNISFLITTFIVWILSIVNYFVTMFRGNEFTLLDIFSIGTALNVINDYNFKISAPFLYASIIIVLISIMYCKLPKYQISRKKTVLIMSLACVSLSFGLEQIKILTWNNAGTMRNGYLVNFIAQAMELLSSKEPKGYSSEYLDMIEKSVSKVSSYNTDINSPNIIIIMNESFADFNIINNVNTEYEITPYYNSLTSNIIKGNALSSVFGGGTANSEYEVLTGNTMAFMTEGATVYQLYLNDNSYSIA